MMMMIVASPLSLPCRILRSPSLPPLFVCSLTHSSTARPFRSTRTRTRSLVRRSAAAAKASARSEKQQKENEEGEAKCGAHGGESGCKRRRLAWAQSRASPAARSVSCKQKHCACARRARSGSRARCAFPAACQGAAAGAHKRARRASSARAHLIRPAWWFAQPDGGAN